MSQARQAVRVTEHGPLQGSEFVWRMTGCDVGQRSFASVSGLSNRAGLAPNKIARRFIAAFRIAANRGDAPVNRPSASFCRRESVSSERYADANIRAERLADLGLRDPFLPVIGDIGQLRALKLRKTLLTASHEVPESRREWQSDRRQSTCYDAGIVRLTRDTARCDNAPSARILYIPADLVPAYAPHQTTARES
jgi:hypothetical protein